MPPKTDVQFNVMLTKDLSLMLEDLATQLDCSKGQVVRQAIKNTHYMVCQRVPTCATGRPCPVPHIHGATNPPNATPPTPVIMPQYPLPHDTNPRGGYDQ